jgi:hypothetical protein
LRWPGRSDDKRQIMKSKLIHDAPQRTFVLVFDQGGCAAYW